MHSLDWMVPRPSIAAEAALRHAIHAVRNEGPADVAKLVSLTENLLQQNHLYRTLLKQATPHIAGLESRGNPHG